MRSLLTTKLEYIREAKRPNHCQAWWAYSLPGSTSRCLIDLETRTVGQMPSHMFTNPILKTLLLNLSSSDHDRQPYTTVHRRNKSSKLITLLASAGELLSVPPTFCLPLMDSAHTSPGSGHPGSQHTPCHHYCHHPYYVITTGVPPWLRKSPGKSGDSQSVLLPTRHTNLPKVNWGPSPSEDHTFVFVIGHWFSKG